LNSQLFLKIYRLLTIQYPLNKKIIGANFKIFKHYSLILLLSAGVILLKYETIILSLIQRFIKKITVMGKSIGIPTPKISAINVAVRASEYFLWRINSRPPQIFLKFSIEVYFV